MTKITITLAAGSNCSGEARKRDIQKNIDSLRRCAAGRMIGVDDVLLIDTISILEEIKCSLPE